MSNSNQLLKDELKQKMFAYYQNYYSNCLRLPHWEEHYNRYRVDEENIIGKRFYEMLKQKVGELHGKKILIVGAGTGAEGFYLFNNVSKDVTMLEPDLKALEILKLKAIQYNLPQDKIVQGFAESLNFSDNSFDVIICYTVLEHVQDYKKSLDEIHRILKPGGRAFIHLPNYAYPEEPHYKIKTFPLAYLAWASRVHMQLKGRLTPFLTSLNFLTVNDVQSYLKEKKYEFETDFHYPKKEDEHPLLFYYSKIFNIPKNQQYFLTKTKI